MSRGRESKNPISGKGRKLRRFIVLAVFFLFVFALGLAFLWSYGSYRYSDNYDESLPRLSRYAAWFIYMGWSGWSLTVWAFVKRHALKSAAVALIITVFVWLDMAVRGNYRNVEQGSSHWATRRELRVFRKEENNAPVANKIFQTVEAHLANNNMIIVAAPGSGKTFNIIIPAIEAATRTKYKQSSFVCTDTKGSVYRTTSKLVRERGVDTYVFNLADPEYSHCYNPLMLIHRDIAETEINQLALVYAKNVRDEEARVGDEIWEKTFKSLLVSVWCYQYKYAVNPLTKQAETMALWRTAELIRGIKLEKNKIANCELYDIVEKIRQIEPLSPVVANFDFVNAGAGETISSVVFTAGSKMEFLSFRVIESLTRKNELPLDELGERPIALYINYNVGSPYKALAALCIEQAFMCLYYSAERKHNNVLPTRVRFLLDELPNICRIYTLPERLSTCREYNIDVTLIVQALEQLKRGYDKASDTLINNCAIQGLFGSSEPDTLKRFSEALGKTTTVEQDYSRNRGRSGGGSESEKQIGRELALPAELLTMNPKYCVLLMQGHHPIFAEKYRTAEQAWYKELGGRGNPQNSRSIENDLMTLRGQHEAEYAAEREMRIARMAMAEGGVS